MSKRDSVFIRKYIEVLKFKSIVRNEKIKIINPLKSKDKTDNSNKLKLPYIKILKKDESSTTRSNVQTIPDNKTIKINKRKKFFQK